MVKKKKLARKRFAAKKFIRERDFEEEYSARNDKRSFFARNSDVLRDVPKVQTRVKTFIVEKPIIIHDKPQHVNISSSEDSKRNVFDSRLSKYSKSKRRKGFEDEDFGAASGAEKEFAEDESLEGSEEELNENMKGERKSANKELDEFGDNGVTNDEFGNEEGLSEGEGEVEGSSEFSETGEEDLSAEESGVSQGGHSRSRGLFVNVWWKKALLWSVLVWVFILLLEFAMQAIKLVEVDLSRQWWFLLAGLIVLSMIYFKFLDRKVGF
ncbi:MAG: hypothetical protein NTY48_06860 [Candidatus Diapherotrites archaeon]|nr:hypothetical protein [Candidatus Diapherotrites archaeon]